MVKEGLLKSDSPRGIWEITDAGRTLAGAGKSFLKYRAVGKEQQFSGEGGRDILRSLANMNLCGPWERAMG